MVSAQDSAVTQGSMCACVSGTKGPLTLSVSVNAAMMIATLL